MGAAFFISIPKFGCMLALANEMGVGTMHPVQLGVLFSKLTSVKRIKSGSPSIAPEWFDTSNS